jgi:hypothetical protein
MIFCGVIQRLRHNKKTCNFVLTNIEERVALFKKGDDAQSVLSQKRDLRTFEKESK